MGLDIDPCHYSRTTSSYWGVLEGDNIRACACEHVNLPTLTPTPTEEITPTPTDEVTPTPEQEITPTPTETLIEPTSTPSASTTAESQSSNPGAPVCTVPDAVARFVGRFSPVLKGSHR